MTVKTFYMSKLKRLTIGLILLFVGIFPPVLIYILIKAEEGFLSVVKTMGVSNIFSILLILSGFYFLMKDRIVVISFELDKFYYNNFFVKSHARSGLFFILFPYLYGKTIYSNIFYKDIDCVESKCGLILLNRKRKSLILHSALIIYVGAVSQGDRDEIFHLLNFHIHGKA
jgi:hypothetical protein